MLEEYIFRIIGIDPGSENIGLAVLDVDVRNATVSLVNAETFTGAYMLKRYKHIAEIYGDRGAKLYGQRQVLHREFEKWKPHAVVVERPFVGRFANAIIALSECMAGIREAVICYNNNIPLDTIDPPTVKMAVGVKGNTKDKGLMQKAVQSLPKMTYAQQVSMDDLDEHSCDAIAVAYWKFRCLYNDAPVFIRATKKKKRKSKGELLREARKTLTEIPIDDESVIYLRRDK